MTYRSLEVLLGINVVIILVFLENFIVFMVINLFKMSIMEIYSDNLGKENMF